jgi:transcriptional regulator with XRE-family HTH domain
MGDRLNRFNITEKDLDYAIRNNELCDAIYNEMKRQELTQNDLAGLMQVDKSLVSRWLSGVHFMNVETLYKLEDILKISIINDNFSRNYERDFDVMFSGGKKGLKASSYKISRMSSMESKGFRKVYSHKGTYNEFAN